MARSAGWIEKPGWRAERPWLDGQPSGRGPSLGQRIQRAGAGTLGLQAGPGPVVTGRHLV
ncbi:MAG: hypothetical protein LBP92_07790 [Deltaproteobacteria bacterium]|nr:hypothetical protein [Deltaproteobacteria bacterium]